MEDRHTIRMKVTQEFKERAEQVAAQSFFVSMPELVEMLVARACAEKAREMQEATYDTERGDWSAALLEQFQAYGYDEDQARELAKGEHNRWLDHRIYFEEAAQAAEAAGTWFHDAEDS